MKPQRLALSFFSFLFLALALTLPAPTALAANDFVIYTGGGGGGGATAAGTGTGLGGAGGDSYYGTPTGAVTPGTTDGAVGGNISTYLGGAAGTGGGGSASGLNGAGGGTSFVATGGSGANITLTTSASTSDNLIIVTGSGGGGGEAYSNGGFATAGNGGSGGNANLSLTGSYAIGNISLTTGAGGDGGNSTSAGGVADYPTAGNGGSGGSITLNADSLSVAGNITLATGADGSDGTLTGTNAAGGSAGLGGSISFNANTLTFAAASSGGITHTVGLTAPAGNGLASFSTNTLSLAAGSSGNVNRVDFTGVANYDTFSLGRVYFAGYTTLTFDADASATGQNAFGNLVLSGTDNILDNSTDFTMAADKVLFIGLDNLVDGDQVLSLNGDSLVAAAGGTRVNVGASDPSTFNSSTINWKDSITLVDSVSGTFDLSTATGTVPKANASETTTLSFKTVIDSSNALVLVVHGKTIGFGGQDTVNAANPLQVQAGQFYDNQFILGYDGGTNITVANGGGFYAANLLVGTTSSADSIDFSAATPWDSTTKTGAGIGYLSVGGLNSDGTAAAGCIATITGTLGTNYSWDAALTIGGTGNDISGALLNSSGAVDLSGRFINFWLPVNLAANDTLVTGLNTDLTGATFGMVIGYVNGTSTGRLDSLTEGVDSITLIENVDATTWAGPTSVVTTNGAINYKFDLDVVSSDLMALFQGEAFDAAMAHNALMANAARYLLLAQGSDRVASVTGSFLPTPQLGAGQNQYGLFFDMGGGHYELDTGSHVESDSFHLLAGPGIRFNHADGSKTDLGLFVEAGWGNFDTYNSFYTGDGDTNYYGIGLLFRHDFVDGFYGEASIRGGRVEAEYNSDYSTNFDMDSAYYGGHVGLGYIVPVTEEGSLDFSAKFLYTHLEGDSDTNDAGDRMKVDDTDSLRTQLGVQYNHKVTDQFTAFVRAAWDYEFDGKTDGNYAAYGIEKIDPTGSSGLGEIGVKWQAGDNFSIDLSAHGLVGQREGYGGNLSLKYEF